MSASGSTYQILDRKAPYRSADPLVKAVATAILGAVKTQTPTDTGHYASMWSMQRLKPAMYLITNPVPYGKYVEYGTRYEPARPTFGRIIAQARAQVSR